MSDIKIYHNNRCSKSRATLAILEEQGVEFEIINYLDTPPSKAQLSTILSQLGFDSARQLMRTNEAIYKTLELKDVQDEDALLEAMIANPKLIERPIVVANNQAAIGRPPEAVKAILG